MNHMDHDVKAFINILERHEGGRRLRDKFDDWCELTYCTYAKTMALTQEQADALEEQYMRVVGRYRDKDAIRAYPEAIALAWKYVQGPQYDDFLGRVAGEIGTLSKGHGQFFTPPDVSRMLAQMTLSDPAYNEILKQNGFLTMGEPAAGAGGMVLAAAETLANQGWDPSTSLLVTATDVEAIAFYMCYIQLTLAGIPAQVIHGNSLTMELWRWHWTPAAKLFLGHHGHLGRDQDGNRTGQRVKMRDFIPESDSQEEVNNAPESPQQLSLF